MQPKAAGSSLINKLTNSLMRNFLHSLGLSFVNEVVVFPLATGMTLLMVYLTLKRDNMKAKYIIFPRIDQKTCLKTIISGGFIPIIIEPEIKGDMRVTNITKIQEIINQYKNENRIEEILCVSSTTSCFAPRGYDDVKSISEICKDNKIHHIVNSAYGIYCGKITEELNLSVKNGEITCIVSSTDKNLMVPVGGAFAYSSNTEFINKLSSNYPGRASAAPIVDTFITLLEMGKLEYKLMIKDRLRLFKQTFEDFTKIAFEFNERMLESTKENKISLCMTLGNNICKDMNSKEVTYLGSMFFNRQISGIKVLTKSDEKELFKFKFYNYGSHSNNDKDLPLIVFAIAIGITEKEVEMFKIKFVKIIRDFISQSKKKLLV